MWYLNRALTNFRNEVNSRWPNRDKRSDGTIGDSDHQSRDSDHNEDPDGSVDAWDMDVDGVDVWDCINAAISHESTRYIIYDSRITSRNMNGGLGEWHTYFGDNPHDKHVHFNTRESHEDSTKPWFGRKKMTEAEFIAAFLKALKTPAIQLEMRRLSISYTGGGIPEGMNVLNVLNAIYQNVEELTNTPPGSVVIPDEQLKRVIKDVLKEGVDTV